MKSLNSAFARIATKRTCQYQIRPESLQGCSWSDCVTCGIGLTTQSPDLDSKSQIWKPLWALWGANLLLLSKPPLPVSKCSLLESAESVVQ
jgi:hypothetical protein